MMDLIRQLEETRKETLSYFNLSEEELQKTYRKGGWNIKQILHHQVDADTVLYYRLRRIYSEGNQVIWGFDPDAWSDKLAYNETSLEINKALYVATRAAVIDLVKRYYKGSEKISFVHNETGCRVLKDEFDKVGWHNESHLKRIREALNS